MNLLTLPPYEALVLIAKMTLIFCWGVILLGFAVRVILRSIMDELFKHKEG